LTGRAFADIVQLTRYRLLILRAVTTPTAAAVLRLDRKAFDSLLTRLGSDFLPRGRQGIERRIPVASLETLLLVQELMDGLGLPAKEALSVARRLTDSVSKGASSAGSGTSLVAGSFTGITIDRERLRQEIEERLALAIESVVRAPRGRPKSR
jgi:hypothetical protein